MGTDRYGAVILSYGPENKHAPLVQQLLDQGVGAEDLLVVHNPSRRGESPAPLPAGVRICVMGNNAGYAAAINLGLREQASRGLATSFVFTHDTRVRPGSIAAANAALEVEQDYGLLGLSLRRTDGSVSCGGFLHPNGVAHVIERPYEGRVHSVDWVDGSAMLLRIAALSGPDPLPERYFMYYEDVWLGLAMNRAGWKVGAALGAEAVSESGNTRRVGAYEYLIARNGYDCVRHFLGERAALTFAAAQLSAAWKDLPKPGGRRFRQPALRQELTLLARARAAGVLSAVVGRWGAPPAHLRAGSDITGAS